MSIKTMLITGIDAGIYTDDELKELLASGLTKMVTSKMIQEHEKNELIILINSKLP